MKEYFTRTGGQVIDQINCIRKNSKCALLLQICKINFLAFGLFYFYFNTLITH